MTVGRAVHAHARAVAAEVYLASAEVRSLTGGTGAGGFATEPAAPVGGGGGGGLAPGRPTGLNAFAGAVLPFV